MRAAHRPLTPGWVAGSVRARHMLARRLGRDRRARWRPAASLDDAPRAARRQRLRAPRCAPGWTSPRRSARSPTTVLWHLRVLAGWVPPGALEPVRALAAWFELVNVDDRLAYLAGGELPAAVRARRAGGGVAARRPARRAAAELRAALAGSPWGDPGRRTTRPAIRLGLRLAWARRVLRVGRRGRRLGRRRRRAAASRASCSSPGRDAGELAGAPPAGVGAGLGAGGATSPRCATRCRRAPRGRCADVDEPGGPLARRGRVVAAGRARRRAPGARRRTGPGGGDRAASCCSGVDAWRVAGALEVAARGGGDRRDGGVRGDCLSSRFPAPMSRVAIVAPAARLRGDARRAGRARASSQLVGPLPAPQRRGGRGAAAPGARRARRTGRARADPAEPRRHRRARARRPARPPRRRGRARPPRRGAPCAAGASRRSSAGCRADELPALARAPRARSARPSSSCPGRRWSSRRRCCARAAWRGRFRPLVDTYGATRYADVDPTPFAAVVVRAHVRDDVRRRRATACCWSRSGCSCAARARRGCSASAPLWPFPVAGGAAGRRLRAALRRGVRPDRARADAVAGAARRARAAARGGGRRRRRAARRRATRSASSTAGARRARAPRCSRRRASPGLRAVRRRRAAGALGVLSRRVTASRSPARGARRRRRRCCCSPASCAEAGLRRRGRAGGRRGRSTPSSASARNAVSFARLAAFGLMHAALGAVVLDGARALWGAGAAGALAAVARCSSSATSAAFALEALVAGVQALRLEYYELFSRVFAGEGEPFAPWRIPRRSTRYASRHDRVAALAAPIALGVAASPGAAWSRARAAPRRCAGCVVAQRRRGASAPLAIVAALALGRGRPGAGAGAATRARPIRAPRSSAPRSRSPARRSAPRSPSPTPARRRSRRSARSRSCSAAPWSSSASPRASRSTASIVAVDPHRQGMSRGRRAIGEDAPGRRATRSPAPTSSPPTTPRPSPRAGTRSRTTSACSSSRRAARAALRAAPRRATVRCVVAVLPE